MKKFLVLSVILLAALCWLVAAPHHPRIPSQTTGRCISAVGFDRVRENCLAAITLHVPSTDGKVTHVGSGVIISEDGFALTKAHVIGRDLTKPIIAFWELPSGEEVSGPAQLASINYDMDLALILVRSTTRFPVAAQLGSSRGLKRNSPIYAISSPAGRETNVFSAGYFTARSRDKQEIASGLMLVIPTIFGCSGGGVYDKSGNLIGISDAIMAAHNLPVSSFAYATAVEDVRIFMAFSFACLEPNSPCVVPLITPPPVVDGGSSEGGTPTSAGVCSPDSKE